MRNLKLILLVATLAVTVSCAKEKKQADSGVPTVQVPPGVYVPPTTGPGLNPGSAYGGSAPLTIVNLDTFNLFNCAPFVLAKWGSCAYANNPQSMTINLNMVKNSGGLYGGTATMSWTDNGIPYTAYFTSGSSPQATQYDIAFNWSGNTVYHAVFEDFAGGFVVVIDQVVDLGDGQIPDKASGSIWFKNFEVTYAPHPPTYCWFVSKGPFDCRPWPSGSGMNTTMSPYPQAGYIKLGTFSDMSLKAAFNTTTRPF